MKDERHGKEVLGFWKVAALGVGAMVGGIFPALGLAIRLSSGAAPLALMIAGIIALFTCYSYASISSPSEPGRNRKILELRIRPGFYNRGYERISLVQLCRHDGLVCIRLWKLRGGATAGGVEI